MKKNLFIFFLLPFFIAFIFSEVIVMKDNRAINGKIIKMDEDTMTVITKTKEIVIDKEDVVKIYYSAKDYEEEKKTKMNQKIIYEEKNQKASEKQEEKYWRLFFDDEKSNKLLKYKYPDNCIIISIYAPIDGYDIIHIRDDKLWYEHKSFDFPGTSIVNGIKLVTKPTIINGIKWFPKFVDNISDKFDLKKSIPEREYYIYAKRINTKTDKVKIIQQPDKENNFTLSLILDDENIGGDTFFEIIIYYYLPKI